MKISVIIPTHNRREFLSEALKSVVSQSLLPDEILVVNNGADKASLSGELASKVKIYDIIPDAGASQARNFGASLATGDYLAFLDDDDLWNKDYLKNAMGAVESGAKCVIGRLDKMTGGKISPFKNAYGKLTLENLFTHNPGVTGSNIVIAKSLFFKIGGYDPSLPTSEDKSLAVEILKNKEEIAVLPDNQVVRRMHGGEQLSKSGSAAMSEGILRFARKYKNMMGSKIYFYNLSKAYKNRIKAGEKSLFAKYFVVKIIYSVLKIF